jgi:ABC-type multidrug transport system fused ATPase/permease subunit
MLFNGHSIRLIIIIIISTLTIFSYPYIPQSSQSTVSVPTNTNLTTPSNMSLRNITTLIETAAILNQTLANQVEQSQQLSRELRANATEQIGTILNQTLANQVEQSQQLSRELRANATEQIKVVATTFKDLPNSIATMLVVAIVLVIAAPVIIDLFMAHYRNTNRKSDLYRALMTFGVLIVVGIVVVYLIALIAFNIFTENENVDALIDVLKNLSTILGTALAAIIAFYFGVKSKDSGEGQQGQRQD